MVKKEKKLFVWQKPQVKIRKKRQTKPKIYENFQQDLFKQQNNQVQIDAGAQKMQEYKQNNQQQIIEVQDKINQIINQQKNLSQRKKNKQAIQYEQMKNKLVQKLQTVKQILFRQEYDLKDIKSLALQQCRTFQCNQIRTFLNSKQNQYTSNVLYIYGTPGSGKTFTIKAILKDLNLQNRTKWINCLSMINKSLLKYTQPLLDQNFRKDIMVIDEFDQMQKQYKNFKFMQSFRVYLKEILTKSCVFQLSKMKFIFISNKSYQSISEEFVDTIKEMIKADSIVQIPFLPYSSGDIFKILKKKIEQIELSIGELIFTNNFLEISSKREYSSFQDIRKIVNFIYSHYQNAQMKKFNQLNLENKRQTFIKDSNPIGMLIVAMPIKQKQIFKKMVKTHELSQQSKSIVLVQWLYKQGSKLGISPQTIDLWLQEWIQLGFLSLKSHQKQGAHLYKTKSITCHLTHDDNLRYFN